MLIQIAKDVDVVAAKQISSLGPIKLEFINFIDKDQEELKQLRWEAMMLVTKANEHMMLHEIKMRKSNLMWTDEEKFKIQEDFFNRFLRHMDDDKADRMSVLLEQMINKHMKI